MAARPKPDALDRPSSFPLQAWADVAVALAIVSLLPNSAPLLVWTVPFVLLPYWGDRCCRVGSLKPDVVFVPDPLNPRWRPLTRCLHDALRVAAFGRRELLLRLCPLYDAHNRPLPYQVLFEPETPRVLVQSRHGTVRQTLSLQPKLELPQPLRIEQTPVSIRIQPRHHGRAAIGQPSTDFVSGSLPLTLMSAGIAALFVPRLGVAALLAGLARLAHKALIAGQRPHGWPLAALAGSRRVQPMPVTTRHDLCRLAIAGLWLLRYACRDTPAGPWLRDPLRLILWGVIVPFAAYRLGRRLTERSTFQQTDTQRRSFARETRARR